MEQYSNLNVHGKITQKADQGTGTNDVVKYPTLTGRVPNKLPAATAANAGKAVVVNSAGNGLEFGEAGKVDDVKIGTTSLVSNKIATIPTASSSALGVVKANGGGIKIESGVLGHTNALTAGNKGTASKVPKVYYDANGHITSSITEVDIAIAGSQITSGTVASARLPTATTSAIGGVTLVQGTSDSTTSVPTDKRMQQYVAAQIDALPEPMLFKGTVGTNGTIESLPAAAASNEGWTYKAITAHAVSTNPAYPAYKVGDTLISNGSAWTVVPSGDEPSGTVTNIKAGTDLTGGTITTTGTIGHANITRTDPAKGSASPGHSGTFDIVEAVTTSATGHVTAVATKTITLPAQYALPLATSGARGGVRIGYTTSGKNYAVQLSDEKMYVNVPWTDTTVDSVTHHYAPAKDDNATLSADASSTTAATWNSTSLVTGVNIQRDAKGHVTGVTVDSIKMPANPNSDTKVRQTTLNGSDNVNRAVILAYNVNTTTGNTDNVVYRSTKIYANDSTGTITATTFNGNATTATTATNATNWTSNPFSASDVTLADM